MQPVLRLNLKVNRGTQTWFWKGRKKQIAGRKEAFIPHLWAGLLAKCDWNLGNELGSGTGDWHMEPQAVSDVFQGLERSG